MIKLTFISDTHRKHQQLKIKKTDFLIHCGDIGWEQTVTLDFFKWFKAQPAKYKLFIQGNHDIAGYNQEYSVRELAKEYGLIYLHHNLVELEGLKFYGSNYTAKFGNWAWMRNRGLDIYNEWQNIPKDIDVLVTHGPAWGILDQTVYNDNAGCEELRDIIKFLPNLKILATGHIHESYGVENRNNIVFINASSVDENYRVVNKPISVNINYE